MKPLLVILLLSPLPVSAFEIESQQPYPGMLPDSAATVNQWMQNMREWEAEQTRKDPAFDINNALAEFFNGSDDSTESEELLQFPSDED
tara:strand:+ start:1568 stop:1834 length:267 start_codon:yes stop_codon:yes gene_type:complete